MNPESAKMQPCVAHTKSQRAAPVLNSFLTLLRIICSFIFVIREEDDRAFALGDAGWVFVPLALADSECQWLERQWLERQWPECQWPECQ
jgi:hypothetical protein